MFSIEFKSKVEYKILTRYLFFLAELAETTLELRFFFPTLVYIFILLYKQSQCNHKIKKNRFNETSIEDLRLNPSHLRVS